MFFTSLIEKINKYLRCHSCYRFLIINITSKLLYIYKIISNSTIHHIQDYPRRAYLW